MLPAPGNYQNVKIGDRSVYESKNGALVFSLDCLIDEQTSIVAYQTLVNKDGAINTRTSENLKDVFGWDGCDPFWLVDADLSQVAFDIVVEDEQGTDGKMYPKVQWINKPGGKNGNGGVKASGDRNSILAKYGAKFRAVAGGSAPRAPARVPQPPPPPAPPVAPAAEPAVKAQPCTMQDAWAALCEAGKNSPKEALEKVWHGALNAVAKGRRQTELNPLEWGAIKDICLEQADAIPY